MFARHDYGDNSSIGYQVIAFQALPLPTPSPVPCLSFLSQHQSHLAHLYLQQIPSL